MVKNPVDANKPLRVLEKALQGGLGLGNVGVVTSRHGVGKLAVITSMGIDKAMRGRPVLHVALGESVSDIRAYRDEILSEILESVDAQNRGDVKTKVDRATQIYTYRHDTLTLPKLAQTLDNLADHADFRPEMIEIQGWPDFRTCDAGDVRDLKRFAAAAKCEIWLAAHTTSSDAVDSRGVPDFLARCESDLSVILALDPTGDQVQLRFVKVHGAPAPANVHLAFDPNSMLLRWR